MRLLLVAAALGLAVVPTPAAWVERIYSRHLYLVSQNVLTPLSGLAGIALFDLLLVVAIVGLPAWWVVAVRRAGRGYRLATLGRLAVNTGLVGAGVYLVFLLVWGLNYRREPLSGKLDHDPQRVTPAALVVLAGETTDRLNALHGPAHAGVWAELDEVPERLGGAFASTQTELGASRLATTGRPKPTALTPYFRLAGIDGMINPFSLEVLVNASVLSSTLR